MLCNKNLIIYAPVVESVDAADSKSVVLWDVGVRVSLGAPPFNYDQTQSINIKLNSANRYRMEKPKVLRPYF